ncbi:MAG TPA: thiazole synthase [Candidatus Dormibacteraeota bacterium]|jgi:thiazole synthase|nr:thiazole synthase [Candidatus Dormibacteraeota bacterium]
MAVTTPAADRLEIGGAVLENRLIHGTGRFPSDAVLRECLEAARPQMVTLAIRRLALDGGGRNELEDVDLSGYTLLPNTAGATTVDQAVRLAHLARAASLSDLIKVEVIGDERTLLPDPAATLEATRLLVEDGFTVLPYCSDDVVLALRLEEAGAAAVMPGAAPIGTTLGIQNPLNLRLIIERVSVPVVVDAGLGVPSEAARCLEWGAAAVLVNTAIARAQNPPEMARAFAEAVVAGRRAHLAGRASISLEAVASSPRPGMVGS